MIVDGIGRGIATSHCGESGQMVATIRQRGNRISQPGVGSEPGESDPLESNTLGGERLRLMFVCFDGPPVSQPKRLERNMVRFFPCILVGIAACILISG